jgi:hypothetical protein
MAGDICNCNEGECINKRKSVNEKRKLEVTNEALPFPYLSILLTFNIYNYLFPFIYAYSLHCVHLQPSLKSF